VGSTKSQVGIKKSGSSMQNIVAEKELISFKLKGLLYEYIVLLLSLSYISVLVPFLPSLLSSSNIKNLSSNLLPLLIVTIGQTFVLIGGIDLSVTSTIALSSVVAGLVMSGDAGLLGNSAWAVPIGTLMVLLTGMFIGWFNGFFITKFDMPPFMVTLATMMFISGFAIWLTKSKNIYNLPSQFTLLGKDSALLVPYSFFIVVLIALLSHFVLKKHLYGRWLYAVGTNKRTSLLAGVPVDRVVIISYVLSGLSASIASILYTSRLETSSPVLGQKIFLDIIAAAVIGGASLFGGKGKITWTISGVLFISVLDNSLNLLSLSHFTILVVKGVIIIAAATIDSFKTRYTKGVV
jgi:ribose/xylose/arabinose/galactoside ABC-type transport system permease subunit